MSTLALLVLVAFGVWLGAGVVLSVRASAREAEAAGERWELGAVVGLVRGVPPEWILVGLVAGVGLVWGVAGG